MFDSRVLYKLKRQFGTTVIIKRYVAGTYDYAEGTITRPSTSTTIKKMIVVPIQESILWKGNLSYIDVVDYYMILDTKDYATLDITTDTATYDGLEYSLKKLSNYQGVLYIVGLKAINNA